MSKHAKHFPAQGDMFHIPEYSASQNRYQIATGRRFPTSEIHQYCTPSTSFPYQEALAMSWMHQAHRAITRGQPCDKLATKSEADIGVGSLGHENDACLAGA